MHGSDIALLKDSFKCVIEIIHWDIIRKAFSISQVIYHSLRTLFLLIILCSLFFKYLFDIEIFQRFLDETPIFYMYCIVTAQTSSFSLAADQVFWCQDEETADIIWRDK